VSKTLTRLLLFGLASLLVWFKELYLANPDMARDKNRLYAAFALRFKKLPLKNPPPALALLLEGYCFDTNDSAQASRFL
jgi:hypothetical protein